MASDTIPLFPLKTVLLPGGPLPLRIFEPRYLDMISDRMKREEPFGVVLIRKEEGKGEEVGSASFHRVGALAHITDWHREKDGLLGITATGGERFRIQDIEQKGDGLWVAEVEFWEPEPEVLLPPEYRSLAKVLAALMDRVGPSHSGMSRKLDDASWVGFRLAELLPIGMSQRQFFLEITDPVQRLEVLKTLVEALASEAGEE